jgi:flagellar basal-body rod protein FlgC
MALDNIFGIGGSALNAQTVRMNAVASNLANASTVASTEAQAFRGKRAVFKTIMDQELNGSGNDNNQGGVKVTEISDDPAPIKKMHDPGNPQADKDGYVYLSNVNEMTEMVEMMAANRSYQNNVEVINAARQLMMRTLDIIKS